MKYLSINEAASRLGVSEKTIRRRVWDGTLPVYRIQNTRGYRVAANDVEAMVVPMRVQP